MGAGNVDLDLSGKPQHDYEVTINGGVGQAIVHLPHDVGVSATAHGGIGKITVTGLEKDGDHWRNDLYDKAKVNVKIDVEGGIGNIKLIG
jgi:predicted membrane protein